ncbi:MAG TPA: MoxR family ATPase [Myxococcaceae bacterium]|jgi:MoxR-like ATPase
MPRNAEVEKINPGDQVALRPRRGLPASVHVFDEDSLLAIRAALATGRPLLVRGEPGTGKSQLARAAAEVLGWPFLPHAVDGLTETRDLLWTVDAVARLAEAQVMATLKDAAGPQQVRDLIGIGRFVRPGPLWWAFDWREAREQAARSGALEPERPEGWTEAKGAVVLIDEIDKADASVPNGLLDALGHGAFEAPGRGPDRPVVMDQACKPLVVITTNEERALPDAFLRRCWVLHLALPEEPEALERTLVERGRAHFREVDGAVLERAAELLAADRRFFKAQDLYAPGLAEYIDLVDAVQDQGAPPAEQLELLEQLRKFALHKPPPQPGKRPPQVPSGKRPEETGQ